MRELGELTLARQLCHQACQWPSRAARANLPPLPDDSHSSLHWWVTPDQSVQGLVSEPMSVGGHVEEGGNTDPEGTSRQWLRVGFRFATASIILLTGASEEDPGTVHAELPLTDASEGQVGRWLDYKLQVAGLKPASGITLPYRLEGRVSYQNFLGREDAVAELCSGYGRTAGALRHLVQTFGHQAVIAPLVRCWPHHFDLAVLFTLSTGDPETARSVGVGFSPGDETLAVPYFYCTPWPVPEPLPSEPVPAPFHWHREGFTSLISNAEGLIDDPTALAAALEAAALYAYRSLEGV
ncbi:MAG: hypothetical protein AAGE43_02925 [Pseudomonadota bacterium]